ncbi:hypothetical protein KI387_029537, partial [Taxus chinensis]
VDNTLGTFVVVDNATLTKSRVVCVRFCIYSLMGSSLPKSISLHSKLGSWEQKIDFENCPLRCEKCQGWGHAKNQCKMTISKVFREKHPKDMDK